MCKGIFSVIYALSLLVATVGAQETSAPKMQSCQRSAPSENVYFLSVGDEISVKVFNRPELDDTLKIRPDGKISLTLLRDIPAADCTATQLEQILHEHYSEFFQDPRVSVIVRSFANQKVFVGGEVGQPGMLPLNGRLTAVGAVLQAGGFRNTARTDSVILLRKDENNKPVARRIDIRSIINHGKDDDAVLQPYDVVFVPKSRIAKANQAVEQWVRQLLPGTLTGGFSYISGQSVRLVP